MWRKTRSALFVDFENIRINPSPAAIASLMAWIEDGLFEPVARKRKLVANRIYWNSSAEKHRDLFAKAGFDVVLCEKYANAKNGADIRMALDVVEMCFKRPSVEEYILFTTDTDFVPVLQRLGEKGKRSIILADESRMTLHTAFKQHADFIIPLRTLKEAYAYQRPLHGWLKRSAGTAKTPVSTPVKAAATPAKANGVADVAAATPAGGDVMSQAERVVVSITSRTPKLFVSRKKIEKGLATIGGYTKSGDTAYFGRKNYQTMMLHLAERNGTLKVSKGKNESASVMYVPREE